MARKKIEFDVIDRCPVPRGLADEIRLLKEKTGSTLNSCDRSSEAEPLLRANRKKSQRELFELAQKGLGNPANPPGFSTHERRNDGESIEHRLERRPRHDELAGDDRTNGERDGVGDPLGVRLRGADELRDDAEDERLDDEEDPATNPERQGQFHLCLPFQLPGERRPPLIEAPRRAKW